MDFQPLRDYMMSLIKKGVPGLEVAICRHHEVLFHECMGYSDYEHTKPASPSDRYWMYSCTKPILVTAAMQCVEKGLFGLDDLVMEYLPAYENAFIMKDGSRQRVGDKITIRHLFTMTAGLDYNLNRPAVRALKEQNPAATTIQIAEALVQDAFSFEAGEKFQYSLCHDVLGAVIEKVSGISLRDYMKKNIFEPLGMTRTDFWTEDEKPDDLAAQYWYHPRRKELMRHDEPNEFVLSKNYYSGGAGLVSCCEDYLKFVDAMSCGGENGQGVRILSRESIELLKTPQLTAFGVSDSFSCTCGADYGYGLGVRTRTQFGEGVPSAIGEFGWDGAAGADMTMDTENELSMMYMQHIRSWPNMLGAVHLRLRDVVYPIVKDQSL